MGEERVGCRRWCGRLVVDEGGGYELWFASGNVYYLVSVMASVDSHVCLPGQVIPIHEHSDTDQQTRFMEFYVLPEDFRRGCVSRLLISVLGGMAVDKVVMAICSFAVVMLENGENVVVMPLYLLANLSRLVEWGREGLLV